MGQTMPLWQKSWALAGAMALSVGCTSAKHQAEARDADDYASSEAQPTTIRTPAPASTSPSTPPSEDEIAPASSAAAAPSTAPADDSWTDEDLERSEAAAATTKPNPNQKETRTLEVVQAFVKERREKVRPCYDAAQAKSPSLKGDVMMRFSLSPEGTVQKIQYSPSESSLQSPAVGDCIAKEMRTWKFPPSSRGMETQVGYPFNFNPRKK